MALHPYARIYFEHEYAEGNYIVSPNNEELGLEAGLEYASQQAEEQGTAIPAVHWERNWNYQTPEVYTTLSAPITSFSTSITCCSVPQSKYVDYRKPRRFWQFVYDRLIQAAEWVYDNKL